MAPLIVHIWREDLDRDEERRFDYLTFALVSLKASTKGVGLRVADSHTRNYPEDDFTPLKTIRRLLVVIGRRSHSGFEGETFEPGDGEVLEIDDLNADFKLIIQKLRPSVGEKVAKPKLPNNDIIMILSKTEVTAPPTKKNCAPQLVFSIDSAKEDESAALTTVFKDDETIARFLVAMSQDKAKQKGVEIKDAKDIARPRPTSTRSVLTLKPLPKIDPKDKGKKVLEEEAESDVESEGVNETKRKFAQLANDKEIARKVQEE
ncbi:hypothetical protein Tco_1160092 [Tanacetum coccineum]